MEHTLKEHHGQIAISSGIILSFISMIVLPIAESYFETSPRKGIIIGIIVLMCLAGSLAFIDPEFAFDGMLGVSIECCFFLIAVRWGN